jgi:AmiR/NasT family two-component response regulator
MQTRHIIGMAQGILMARHGLTPEHAFGVLRRYSSQQNVRLRVVAERVVREFGPIPPQ